MPLRDENRWGVLEDAEFFGDSISTGELRVQGRLYERYMRYERQRYNPRYKNTISPVICIYLLTSFDQNVHFGHRKP